MIIYSVIKYLIAVVSILIIGGILPGIRLRGNSFWTASLVALVIGLLNFLVYPFMVIITIPITVFSFGIFLFILNGLVVWWASKIVGRFEVDNFWWAILFSILVSFITFVFEWYVFPTGSY